MLGGVQFFHNLFTARDLPAAASGAQIKNPQEHSQGKKWCPVKIKTPITIAIFLTASTKVISSLII